MREAAGFLQKRSEKPVRDDEAVAVDALLSSTCAGDADDASLLVLGSPARRRRGRLTRPTALGRSRGASTFETPRVAVLGSVRGAAAKSWSRVDLGNEVLTRVRTTRLAGSQSLLDEPLSRKIELP